MIKTKSEIKAIMLIVEAVDKVIEKYQKKAMKEREKINNASITYKGEKYYSEKDLMDAYACDIFSCSTYDRLLERLNKVKFGISGNEMTENELIVSDLNIYKNSLLNELALDKQLKDRQKKVETRMKGLIEEGYSIREAETIIGNEELMRYE